MDDKKRKHVVRAGGSIVSITWILTFVRMLIAGPPYEAIAVLDALIDRQILYESLILIGVLSLGAFGYPYAIWCCKFPERRKQKQRWVESQQTSEAQRLLLELKRYATHIERLDTPNETTHDIGTTVGASLTLTLNKLEQLGFTCPADISGKDWMKILDQVYLYLEEYGIVKARYVMEQIFEDHRQGRKRKVSEGYRLEPCQR